MAFITKTWKRPGHILWNLNGLTLFKWKSWKIWLMSSLKCCPWRRRKRMAKLLHSYEMTFWLDDRFSALIRVKNTHELTLSAFPPTRQTRTSLKIVQKSFSEKLSLYLFLDFRKIIFESNVFVDWVNNLFLVCVCTHHLIFLQIKQEGSSWLLRLRLKLIPD